jgi:MFS family permease
MFMASIPLAGIIAGPLSGTIMHAMEGVAGVRGWRWLFILEGAPALVLAVVAYVWLRDRPSNAPWLTASEVATIQRDLDADAAATEGSGHKSFGDALRSPRFYLLVGMGVALLASVSNVFFWLPTIIRTSGVKDVWVIGLMSAGPFLAGFIVQYLVARRSDLRDERRWHAAVSALLAAAGWCALTFVANDPVLALLAMTVAAAGTFATTGPFWAMPSLYLGRKAAAGGIALISTLAGIGSLISPVIVGWLNEQTKTLAAGQFFLAGLLVIGAVTVVAIGPHSVTTRQPSLSPAA